MKKTLTNLFIACTLLLLIAGQLNAAPVDEGRARAIASSVLVGKTIVQQPVSQKAMVRNGADKPKPAYYVFNAENDGGFVLVSGDDSLPLLLGYSHQGSFDVNNMPESLQMYIELLAKRLESGELDSSHAATRSSDEPGTIIVDALCKTQWDQDIPFNLLCPKFDDKRAPCGCVATAMAQIMKYYEWPTSGRGSVVYNVSGYGVLSRDFSQSQYNWAVMKNTGGLIRDAAARDAMATICYDAGTSVKMQYGPTGSGAYEENARTSLIDYFKYKGSTLDLRRRACYESLEAWMYDVKGELDSRRPIFYTGIDTIYGGGHAFIIDGYDSNDFVHVNWGWGGHCDGFYNINTLDPKEVKQAYARRQMMIIGIIPDYTEQDKKPGQYRIYMEDVPECSGTYSVGNKFILTYRNIFNMGFTSRVYTIGVGLYDADGQLLKEISTESSEIEVSYTQQFRPSYGFSYFDIAAQINEDTPEGKYAIRAIFREEGFTDWMLPDMVGGSRLNWIPIVIKNGKVYLNSPEGPEPPTAIESNYADKNAEVSSTEYFDLGGRKIAQPEKKSLYIRRDHYSNGTIKSTKVVY